MSLKDKLKKIDVQTPKEFVDEKVPVASVISPKAVVTEEEMKLAAIKSLSSQVDAADVSVRSVRKKKDNLNLSEKSELQLERAVIVADATKQSKRQVVVAQRLIEELFMIGERLKYLAFTGDKTAIRILEDMRESGIVDEYIYKKK